MIFEGIGLSPVPLVAFPGRALEGGCGLGYSKKKMKIIFEIPQLLKTPELIFYGIEDSAPLVPYPLKKMASGLKELTQRCCSNDKQL